MIILGKNEKRKFFLRKVEGRQREIECTKAQLKDFRPLVFFNH